ncbi:uracil-DNA glycosylase [Candidatus Saccharibacteria bacterium]|nr:uracil-DNA glycosylase [Candidatus Saccharibacteria bacterium]
MNKQSQLERLQREITDKGICSELALNAKNLVMGDGNVDSNIVFIGEAPGKAEDEQGQPFVGASGRFLNEMLEAAGMVRSDVYITNIVKYRPPNNRDPSEEEKQEFWPYLMRQLEIINPTVVITLGRHSGKCFISDLLISRDHGHARIVKYHEHELLVVPLYHPAAALYNGSMRQTLIDDFLLAAQVAKTGSLPEPKI